MQGRKGVQQVSAAFAEPVTAVVVIDDGRDAKLAAERGHVAGGGAGLRDDRAHGGHGPDQLRGVGPGHQHRAAGDRLELVGRVQAEDPAGPDAALQYRKWLVHSDASRDPQAFILSPECAVAIAQAIVRAPDAYTAGRAAALEAVRLLSEAHRDGALRIAPRELPWLDRVRATIEATPDTETEFIGQMMAEVDTTRFVAADYGIA